MSFVANELESAVYTTVLSDESGAVVPGSSLTALTLTLYDTKSGSVINNRDHQNILNTNDVSIDSNGLLTWNLKPADNAILNPTTATSPITINGETYQGYETHAAVFHATWSGGNKAKSHQITIIVANLNKLP